MRQAARIRAGGSSPNSLMNSLPPFYGAPNVIGITWTPPSQSGSDLVSSCCAHLLGAFLLSWRSNACLAISFAEIQYARRDFYRGYDSIFRAIARLCGILRSNSLRINRYEC